jgi:hypothetical protein
MGLSDRLSGCDFSSSVPHTYQMLCMEAAASRNSRQVCLHSLDAAVCHLVKQHAGHQ